MRGGTLRLLRIKLNKLIPNNLFYKEQFLEFTCITGYDRYSRKFNIMKNRSESFFFFFFFFFFLVWNRNYSKLCCIKRHYQITFQAHFRRWGLLRIHQFGGFLTEVSKCWRHNSYQIVLNLYTIVLFLFQYPIC